MDINKCGYSYRGKCRHISSIGTNCDGVDIYRGVTDNTLNLNIYYNQSNRQIIKNM